MRARISVLACTLATCATTTTGQPTVGDGPTATISVADGRLAVDQFTLEVPRDAPRKIVIRLDAPRGYRFDPQEGITWGMGPFFKPGSDLACDPPFHATRIVCDNRKPDDGRLRSYKYTVKVLDDKGVPLRTLDPFINNR